MNPVDGQAYRQTYDASETRLFIASGTIPRWGLLEQTALALKADLTISAGLHCKLTLFCFLQDLADTQSDTPHPSTHTLFMATLTSISKNS